LVGWEGVVKVREGMNVLAPKKRTETGRGIPVAALCERR
jgi:hypothetical protein